MSFCYEAGPCGYEIYRQLRELKQDCLVAAPSLIPKKAGDRVKTDRRDSLSLARLHRAGDLTAVWVPGGEQEALRDLTRAREDMEHLQRLKAFLLRHGKLSGKSNWMQAYFCWLETVKFEQPASCAAGADGGGLDLRFSARKTSVPQRRAARSALGTLMKAPMPSETFTQLLSSY